MRLYHTRVLGAVGLQAVAFGVSYAILTHGIDAAAARNGIALGVGVFATTLIHEVAHYLAAERRGARPRWAEDRASIYNYPISLRDQRLISAAGPIAGLLTGIIFVGLAALARSPLLFAVAGCVAANQTLMLAPFFNDGALLFMRKDQFYEKSHINPQLAR